MTTISAILLRKTGYFFAFAEKFPYEGTFLGGKMEHKRISVVCFLFFNFSRTNFNQTNQPTRAMKKRTNDKYFYDQNSRTGTLLHDILFLAEYEWGRGDRQNWGDIKNGIFRKEKQIKNYCLLQLLSSNHLSVPRNILFGFLGKCKTSFPTAAAIKLFGYCVMDISILWYFWMFSRQEKAYWWRGLHVSANSSYSRVIVDSRNCMSV